MLTELFVHRALRTTSTSSFSRTSAGQVRAQITLRLNRPHVQTLCSAALAAAQTIIVSCHSNISEQSSSRRVKLVQAHWILVVDGRKRIVKGFVLRIISHSWSSFVIMDGEVRLE